MSNNINWANPVFDVKTSQNYLARLQEFLATQQPGGNSSNENKRKNPSTESEVDTAAAIKDRKHGASRSIDQATHSHKKEGSSERESPEAEGSKPRNGKGSTSDKRKEQNRNAQRAFRERKEKVLRDLEDKVSELERRNDNTASENQNLKEMITRLQEENAKLRQTTSSAPSSDFTFTVPSAPAQTTAPAFSQPALPSNIASQSAEAPSSFNNNNILSFLSSAPPAQTNPTPFRMINPSPPINTTNNSAGNTLKSIDEWMMNWNSSAFGTEMPQAVPPSVTNLTEQPADNGFASLWNSLNQGNESTFSALQNQQAQQQTTADNSNFFSLFQNAFSPSLDGQAPASNSNSSFSQYVNNANTAPYNTQGSQNTGNNNLFPFASANTSSSGGSSSGNNGSGNQQVPQQRHNTNSTGPNSSHADSPETCASSTSGGSDPSDAQPSTPNNGQLLFGSNSKSKSKSGDSVQSTFPDLAFTASSFSNGSLSGTDNSAAFGNMFGGNTFANVTTPSGVFDAMNYRDPLLGNLADTSAPGVNDYNFGSFMPGNSTGTNVGNKRSDTLDFSDFLVASPPSTTQSPPVSGNLFQMPGNGKHESNSSSSLPTLGSLSNSTSPVSTQPSPQTSLNTTSTSTGATSANGTPNWLPYDIPYSHPLIQHVMKDQIQKDKEEFENRMRNVPRQKPCDIEGLCSDMAMKATCKDHARERIAKAMQTDEQTIKLYNEYLASAGQNLQQTPSPNLN